MSNKNVINEIKKAAGEKFTEKEIGDFLNMAARLASKSILNALIEVISEHIEKGFDSVEGDRLIGRIRELMPYKEAGYTRIELDLPGMNIGELHISLSLVPLGYRTEIDVPPNDEFIKDLCKQYVFIKQTACAYWKQFCEENQEIAKRVREYCNDIDFSELVIDPANNTTLYWDPACKKRIGIFCYYVDKQGKPFVKKGNK